MSGEEDAQLVKDISRNYLHHKYVEAEVNELVCVCCLLDPRFTDQCVNTDDLDLVKSRSEEAMINLGLE